jgi:hypothetical protein
MKQATTPISGTSTRSCHCSGLSMSRPNGSPPGRKPRNLVVDPVRARLPVRRRQQVRPHQEIRPPEQRRPGAAPGQRPLIDDPGAAPDGFRRRLASILGPADVRDVQPVRTEPLKHGSLVHLAAPDQILEPDIELPGRPQLPPRPQ